MLARPQADFPKADLLPENADTLELFIMNSDVVEQSHKLADASSFLYRTGHPALAATVAVRDPEHAAAVSYGFTLYESIAVMARPEADPSIHNSLDTNKAILNTHLRLQRYYIDELLAADESFRQGMRFTANVVEAGGVRRFASDASFVVAGAALAHQLEMRAGDPSLLLQ